MLEIGNHWEWLTEESLLSYYPCRSRPWQGKGPFNTKCYPAPWQEQWVAKAQGVMQHDDAVAAMHWHMLYGSCGGSTGSSGSFGIDGSLGHRQRRGCCCMRGAAAVESAAWAAEAAASARQTQKHGLALLVLKQQPDVWRRLCGMLYLCGTQWGVPHTI